MVFRHPCRSWVSCRNLPAYDQLKIIRHQSQFIGLPHIRQRVLRRKTSVDTRSVREDAAMGLFSDLMGKIFHHAPAAHAGPSAGTASPAGGAPPSTAAPPSATVDVAAVLDQLTAQNPQELDWRYSIVDLMKLVGMDSSFGARKALAAELGLRAGEGIVAWIGTEASAHRIPPNVPSSRIRVFRFSQKMIVIAGLP
jgi:hypothetical protein